MCGEPYATIYPAGLWTTDFCPVAPSSLTGRLCGLKLDRAHIFVFFAGGLARREDCRHSAHLHTAAKSTSTGIDFADIQFAVDETAPIFLHHPLLTSEARAASWGLGYDENSLRASS